MSQLSFASLYPKKKSTLRGEQFLKEMREVVPWRKMAHIIKPHYYSNKSGRPAYDLTLMIKIHCLQNWYNLGDLAMEEAIYDRRSFAEFLDLDLMLNKIPDETTILNFRHLLERNQLTKELFKMIREHLEKRGLIMKEGTIVDATIITAPSSTKNQDKKRDSEMSSTCKNNSWHFGMKMHIGVDAKSGLVHMVESSTGKVSDREKFADLLHGEEKAVFGDKGYVNKVDKHYARDAGIFWGVLDKRGPGKDLSNRQKKRNMKLSKIRAKVEHPFRVVKALWGHRKVRYKGLEKNTSQFNLLFGLSNLYMVRKSLLQES